MQRAWWGYTSKNDGLRQERRDVGLKAAEEKEGGISNVN